MSVAIPEAIKTWIATEASGTSFREAVGDRYYHVTAPDNTAWPLAVYTVTQSANPTNYFNAPAGEVWRVAWSIWVDPDTASDNDALAIEAKLFARMEAATFSATGYDRVFSRCVARGQTAIDGSGIRVDSEYELRCGRTA